MRQTARQSNLHGSSRCRPLLGWSCLLLLALGACGGGGGGGGGEPEPPAVAPSGLRGTVHLQSLELGRVSEQEPNNSAAQPTWLSPVFPRCAFEVVGHVAQPAAEFGVSDPLDVLRFVSVADQDVALALTFRTFGSTPSTVEVEVRDVETDTQVATTSGGAQPLLTSFAAQAGRAYDFHVQATSGSAAYMVRAVLTNAVSPKPSLKVSAPAKLDRPPFPAATRVEDGDPACACDRVLVQMTTGERPDAICAAFGVRAERQLASGTWCLCFDAVSPGAGRHRAVALAKDISACTGVRFAEPDWIVQPLSIPADEKYGCQWNLRAVGCEAAWDISTGSADVVIGIVDSGVLSSHPDLEGQLEPGYDFISDAGVAGDGNGRDLDPEDMGDQFLPSGLSTWHGTHVAGICVAKADQRGVTGVAPGCRVMPLRALGIGGGFVSDVADAILFGAALAAVPGRGALAEPLDVINLSVGLGVDSGELRDACTRAFNRGVFLVGASGNTAQTVLFPARYDSVFAVGAVDTRLRSTAYSNFGTELDLVAPGGLAQQDNWARGWPDHIISCLRDETVWPHVSHVAGLQGTSQAAPHVAAAAALLRSIDPNISLTGMATVLTETALDVGAEGVDVAHGSGLLQVHTAVKRVLSDLGTPRADAPIAVLPTWSLRFGGFDTLTTLPISNGGGGTLFLTASPTSTDDGGAWLNASLQTSTGDSNVDGVQVTVNRIGLPNGRYSGSIRLAGPSGVVGVISVVMYVGDLARMGKPLHVVSIEEGTGIARRAATVYPSYRWRYWLTNLPASLYKLEGGEDLDGDTFFCEPADHCAWFGGPTEATATVVAPLADQPAIEGLHILLLPDPGP